MIQRRREPGREGRRDTLSRGQLVVMIKML